MMTPIEVTRSKLPGDMAHMMPAQNTDPKEYRQVQRRKKDNVPRDLIGNTAWYEDSRQPEPGYIIWRADKKGQQVIAHIEYIETEDAWFGLHYVKGMPYATIGSKIDKGKYGLKRKGGKTPNLYLWRNDPEPLSEEETPSDIPTILQTQGSPPTKFDGDRKMAKKFLNDFKTYKFLNRKNETMKIPANRVTLALTFIKGEHV